MAAIFALPLPLTHVASNSATSAPAANMNLDAPGMVWRSDVITNVYFMFRVSGPWDTLALVGHNVGSANLLRVRAATSEAATTSAPTYDATITAWSGVAPLAGAITLLTLPAPRAETFIRVDFVAGPAPDSGYIEAQRLVIARRLENVGVDLGAEQTFDTGSVIESGPGYTSVDRYPTKIGYKLSISDIKEADYQANWFPFLARVMDQRGFLFTPDDDPAYLQRQAVFARMTSSAKGYAKASDFMVVDMGLTSIS